MKTFIKTVKGFPILNVCVEPNALGQTSCSILESVRSYERSVGWQWFISMQINIKDLHGPNNVLLVKYKTLVFSENSYIIAIL